MSFAGLSPDGTLVEIVEIPGHPYFLGCQFHPEFKSRPRDPHPLFSRFIEASLRYQKQAEDHRRAE
jgi:CTP synthase